MVTLKKQELSHMHVNAYSIDSTYNKSSVPIYMRTPIRNTRPQILIASSLYSHPSAIRLKTVSFASRLDMSISCKSHPAVAIHLAREEDNNYLKSL